MSSELVAVGHGIRDPLQRERAEAYDPGMALHPQAQKLVDQMVAVGAPPMSSLDPAAARQVMLQMTRLGTPGPAEVTAEDLSVPGPDGPVPVRVYRPRR